ncbi:hypothetical protein G647_09365 [Cladophialophora carrionii CBS 160.54]|uniref:Uncharacterized protein n=1 Tax=Cladophialophora carrionii CBS 160.54 TaxID=1279043 RepID=V9CYS3_9EURO|nr:uncharacterized protein G647_09365 [Cladophialophora carrionii CBS 160.54]ETI19531.1 hypothetical protein G647_09365 [Cladophialophora carrionii CBS 160.54]
MVKPTLALCGRLRFTTKQVGRGFYRGNRTGSMGAHTEYGKYMIDWRKTTHFNVPDTKDFSLSPFVTQEMEQTPRVEEGPGGALYTPPRVDGLEFLKAWKKLNPAQYDSVVDYQENQTAAIEQSYEEGAAQNQESAQQQTYMQSAEAGRSPLQQQQIRQMHTTSRRLGSAQRSATVVSNPPSAKEWLDMTREERKALINAATTAKIRELKKERGEHVTPAEKQAIKSDMKIRLRQELIGTGMFQDKKEYDKMMSAEGRSRVKEGLPKRTPEEKREFLLSLLQKTGNADVALERILTEPVSVGKPS